MLNGCLLKSMIYRFIKCIMPHAYFKKACLICLHSNSLTTCCPGLSFLLSFLEGHTFVKTEVFLLEAHYQGPVQGTCSPHPLTSTLPLHQQRWRPCTHCCGSSCSHSPGMLILSVTKNNILYNTFVG